MPLDGHAYLVSQGWQGKGNGLRHGSIDRPVTVSQKKTLSGVGKDRDEAFPFWDHVFSAAVNAVKIKVYNSDSEDTDTDESKNPITFQRTKTGIISNRRPVVGTPASHSGTSTPSSHASGSTTPRMSIMAAAKQESARRTLYSMFFRGPILGTDIVEEMAKVDIAEDTEDIVVCLKDIKTLEKEEIGVFGNKEKKRKRESEEEDEEEGKSKIKSKKSCRKGKEAVATSAEVAEDDGINIDNIATISKKEIRRKKRKEEAQQEVEDVDSTKLEKAERKRLRAEKRARKEEKRKRREERKIAMSKVVEEPQSPPEPEPTPIERNSELSGKKRKKKDNEEKSKKKRKPESS